MRAALNQNPSHSPILPPHISPSDSLFSPIPPPSHFLFDPMRSRIPDLHWAGPLLGLRLLVLVQLLQTLLLQAAPRRAVSSRYALRLCFDCIQRVVGLGFRVWAVGSRYALRLCFDCIQRVVGLGFRVWGIGFGVWGLGFGTA